MNNIEPVFIGENNVLDISSDVFNLEEESDSKNYNGVGLSNTFEETLEEFNQRYESLPLTEFKDYNNHNFNVVAQDTVIIGYRSDFDGVAEDATDDTLIYGGKGFIIQKNVRLPVARDENGEPLLNSNNEQILVDDGVAVSDKYRYSYISGRNNKYSDLNPPQIVDRQTLVIPEYSQLIAEEANTQGLTEIEYNPNSHGRLWNQNFPPSGSEEAPTLVRVTGGSLNIPSRVDLSNYIIIVEEGNINFYSRRGNNLLENVTLIAENGSINLKNAKVKDSNIFASRNIYTGRGSRFEGDNLIASKKGNIYFKGKSEDENLDVISGRSIIYDTYSDNRGEFLASDNFIFRKSSTIYGSIAAKDNIIFNRRSKVVATQPTEISLSDVTITEGDEGVKYAQVEVSLSKESIFQTVVDFKTEEGTAKDGVDYKASSGTLIFAPRETSKTIFIPILNNREYELEEAFSVILGEPTRGIINDYEARVTIVDNDENIGLPEININDINILEVNNGSSNAIFTVTLSEASSEEIRVDFNTEDDTAREGVDYEATSGTLSFAPGETSKTVAVKVYGDILDEENSSFNLNLSNASNGMLIDDQGIATIVDNDIFAEISLVEENYVSETSLLVDLGLETNEEGEYVGSRTLSFDIGRVWGEESQNGKEDILLVYLVDGSNPSETLLDNGQPGTAIFTLSGEEANFTPGLVSFDGTTVTIDLTSLKEETQGLLKFQLLNQDGDSNALIQVNKIENITDIEGSQNPIFLTTSNIVNPGEATNLDNLGDVSQITPIIENIGFDSTTGKYQGQLKLSNRGDAIGGNTVVVFEDLPDGVTLVNSSGVDKDGNPYLNFRNAIPSGGLGKNKESDAILFTIDNPDLDPLSLNLKVLGGANQAPIFTPINNLSVTPGAKIEIPLEAIDSDGDNVTFKIKSEGELPKGMLEGSGKLTFNPSPDDIGIYEFTLIATDGVASVEENVTLEVVADLITTTRISGSLLDIDGTPLSGVVIELGSITGLTDSQGNFILEIPPEETSDTLKIYAEALTGDKTYPFIAEKLPLLLGHDTYDGVNNIIDRPIYLPPLDLDNGVTINPNVTTIVTTTNIQGAGVTVEANSLEDTDGNPFTGILSITEVPTELTPAALPENLAPDLVVTIQPGEMVFTTPALLTLPNLAGWAAGLEMDLWSINPNTGDFDNVGTGKVSEDGTIIETIEGGILNSSWHFFAPRVVAERLPENNSPFVPCNECVETQELSSQVELKTGAVIESHDLVSYSSNGVNRGITLTYDSLRADTRPIISVSYDNVNPNLIASEPDDFYLLADLTIHGENFDYSEGTNYWKVDGEGDVRASLQADLKEFASGKYNYTLDNGFRILWNNQFVGTSTDLEGELLHVNSIESAFGSGWGISGWEEIVENSDGTLLLINGDGGEMFFETPENGIYTNPPGDFSILEKLPDGTFRRTMKDQSVYLFNSDNKLASVTDSNGNATNYLYDAQGELTKIIDPVGLETIFTYNNQGKVSKITDPGNRETILEYDEDGNLIRITNPDGSFRTWEYDNNRNMIGETDERGFQESVTYNEFGRAIKAIQKDGTIIQVNPTDTQGLFRKELTSQYNNPVPVVIGNGNSTYVDGNGNVRSTNLDTAGQRISTQDGEGNTGNVERQDVVLITSQTDGRGFETNYTYDENANVINISDELSIEDKGEVFPDQIYTTGNRPLQLIQGDINGDNKLDIISLNDSFSGEKAVSVFLSDEDVFFKGILDYDGPENPTKLEIEDINNDGIPDLAILGVGDGYGGEGAVSILLGEEGGLFGEKNNYTVGEESIEFALEDFNGDGLSDISKNPLCFEHFGLSKIGFM